MFHEHFARPFRPMTQVSSSLLDHVDDPSFGRSVAADAPLDARYLAAEAEYQQIWEEIRTTRFNSEWTTEMRLLELMRLAQLQDQLDVEVQRQSEAYLRSFVDSLKLDEIGGKGWILGGIHCEIGAKSQPATRFK
jgi:hypothetical protein